MMTDESIFWEAVLNRDSSFDGRFFYGVLTSKVYCRPGCAARAPLRKNVRFYESPVEAEADGLRPCKRCKPLDAPLKDLHEKFRQVRVYIQKHLDDPAALKLAALSERFGMSPFHFQKTFRSVTGVTPKQYAGRLRLDTFKEDLRTAGNVTDAIYRAGYPSSSRVYERSGVNLGMTPRQYRAGGESVEISYAATETVLGRILIGATDRGLCFVEFGDSDEDLLASLKAEFPAAKIVPTPTPYPEQFSAWMNRLKAFLGGELFSPNPPISLHGTAFQLKVWRYLQTIPSGEVQSYTEVAKAIGNPKGVRAVASACAANKVAVLVPCHRVIRGDGSLGGYRWGLDRKRVLIERERRAASSR